jgi:hypothetical protein
MRKKYWMRGGERARKGHWLYGFIIANSPASEEKSGFADRAIGGFEA